MAPASASRGPSASSSGSEVARVPAKMASGGGGGGVSVPALWSEVNRYGQNGDFTRALKTVNKSKCPRGRRGRGSRPAGRMRPPSGARDHLPADPGRGEPTAAAAGAPSGRGTQPLRVLAGPGSVAASGHVCFPLPSARGQGISEGTAAAGVPSKVFLLHCTVCTSSLANAPFPSRPFRPPFSGVMRQYR